MTKTQWRLYVIGQWIDKFVWPVRWALWKSIAGMLWLLRPDWRRHYLSAINNGMCNQEWALAVPTRWRRIVTGAL